MPADHELWVLLGADYAGKSTVMAGLADRPGPGWQFVSYDDRFLDDDLWLARRLRQDVETGLPEVLDRYSKDFVLTLVQSALVFLRDQAAARRAGGPVLVDSYYYKFLAKCRMHGLVNEVFFGWWRSFPPPDRVLFLDVPPAAAWARSGGGARVNALETRGGDRAAFESFQVRLRDLLLEETRGVRVDVVDAQDGPERTLRAVAELMVEGT